MNNDPFQVIKRLVITEKNMDLNQLNKYVFEVDRRANKIEIRKAISELFNVDIVSVNTLRNKGEQKRFGSRSVKRRPSKKAVVTVAAGQSIDLLE